MTKRGTLADLAAKKPSAVAPSPARPVAPASSPVGTMEPAERRIGQTLRLRPEAWRTLKDMAAQATVETGNRVTAHDLLLEAVGDLFRKHGRSTPA